MNNTDNMPLFKQGGSRNKKGKPFFWRTVIRLYLHDDVFRGAIDLVLIGGFIFCLLGLSPNLGDWVSNISPFSQTATVEQENNATEEQVKKLEPSSIGNGTTVATVATPIQAARESNTAAKNTPTETSSPLKSADKGQFPNKNTQEYHPPASKQTHVMPIEYAWISKLEMHERELFSQALSLTSQEPEQAIAMVDAFIKKGNPDAQYIVGEAHLSDAMRMDMTRKKKKITVSMSWYKKAAEQGQPMAQYQLAQIYRLSATDDPDRARKEAAQWYEIARKNPHSKGGKAELELGRMYERGQYFDKDITKAVKYYTESAEKGNPMAMSNIGAVYFNGVSPYTRDIDKAVSYTQKAAELGYGKAQINLATIYISGHLKDTPENTNFIKWTEKAANKGEMEAILRLGRYYQYGAAPLYKKDYNAAFEWYKLGALKKHFEAQYALASLYEKGLGVKQDYIQAYVYYTLSQSSYKRHIRNQYRLNEGRIKDTSLLNYHKAELSLRKLKEKMTSADIHYAKRMIEGLAE